MGPESVHVGIDLGQAVDYTAIVVAQVSERERATPAVEEEPKKPGVPRAPNPAPKMETVYRIQRIERLPLGMPYPDVAAYIVQLLVAIFEHARERYNVHGFAEPQTPDRRVYMDATGVGRPVLDILRQAMKDERRTAGCWLYPLTFVHGVAYDRGAGRLGKTYLVSRLQALLQTSRIDLPKRDPEITAMVREIQDYRIEIDRDGHDTYGGKVGSHDDLATALGLAVIDEPNDYRVMFGPKLW